MKGRLWFDALAIIATSVQAQAPLERGKYLVEGILTCGNCHTPRGEKGVLDTAHRHAGGPQVWGTEKKKVRLSNITREREPGSGGGTAEQGKAAIHDGRRPNGQQ